MLVKYKLNHHHLALLNFYPLKTMLVKYKLDFIKYIIKMK